MIRRLSLPILGLAVLALSACSGAEESTLLEPEAPLLDVTAEGLVTNTVQIALKCSAGVTGSAEYSVRPSATLYSLACPAEVRRHIAGANTGFIVSFSPIDDAPNDCDAGVRFFFTDLASRTKCTVNGRDVGGKPMATVVMKYVKD